MLANTKNLNDVVQILQKILAQSSTSSSSEANQVTVLPTGKGTTVSMTLNKVTTTISLTQANAPNFTLVLTQGTGANKVIWPSSIKWQFGIAPVLSYKKDQVDILYFISLDNGNTWLGSMIGGGY